MSPLVRSLVRASCLAIVFLTNGPVLGLGTCDANASCDGAPADGLLSGFPSLKPHKHWFHSDAWDLGGWVAGGVTLNADDNRSGNGNAPYGYNNVSDGAVLNQMWFYWQKEIDEDVDGFDWGFRADYVFGTDGPDNQAFGDQSWDFGWNSSRDYGSAIPQLYADLKYDNWLVRAGYFLTPIGYENVPAPLNFFYSRSLTFYYSEPNTHSGFLATYTVNDRLSVQGGWTAGMDGSFENSLRASTFLGGASLELSEDTTISWSFLTGDWGDGSGTNGSVGTEGDIYLHSIILEHSLSERCSYVFHHDLGINSNLPTASTSWYAIVQYLTYGVSETCQLGARVEWFRDDSGARIGQSGDYYEITTGLNWNCCEKVVLRPEIRWDWSRGAGLPYDDGTQDEFFTYALSGILQF